ncbi:uncharacterized protein CTHT_0064580, partial [Thermochaetoides thermophila DSM 1495]
VNQLCTRARGPGIRVDPNKTEVLYIPPPGATGARRGRIDPTTTSTQAERTSFLRGKSVKWLGVSLAPSSALRPKQPRGRRRQHRWWGWSSAYPTRGSGAFPPGRSQDLRAVVTPSLLYGMVQLDTGPTRAAVDGHLAPSKIMPVWSSLTKVANAAPRVIFPVWWTIPTT